MAILPKATLLYHIMSYGTPYEFSIRAMNLGERGFEGIMNLERKELW